MTDTYTLEYETEEIYQIACNGNYMGTDEVVDKLNDLTKENRILKITYAKCKDCKHADLYNPQFAYPHIDPQCRMNIKTIHSDSNACENFELIGRKSR